MTDRQPRSKPIPSAAAANADEPHRPESGLNFDPYKFIKVAVPPELRQQMLRARLARLEPEFFRDTLPPNQPTEVAPDLLKLESSAAAQSRRRPVKLVLACLLCALLLGVAWFASATRNESQSARIAATTPPIPAKRTAPSALAAPSATSVASTAPVVPSRSASLVGPTVGGSPQRAASKTAVEPLSTALARTKPAAREPSQAADALLTTPTSEPVPPPPAASAPVQTPWFKPK